MSEKKPIRRNRVKEHREKLTNALIESLSNGEPMPWQKPWNSSFSRPFNPVSASRYKGGNVLQLMAEQSARESDDPRWLTYKQIQKMGYTLREGAKGASIEFWKFNQPSPKKVAEDDNAIDTIATGKDAEDESENTQQPMRPIALYYVVFNGADIEGLPPLVTPEREFSSHALAERLIDASGAVIEHKAVLKMGVDGFTADCMAGYSVAGDKIIMPPKAAFDSTDGYYSTALHELAHWTGHPSRLDRFDETQPAKFGTPDYAKEELRAEISAFFLKSSLGIEGNSMNHVSYVDSWLDVLKKDHHEIYRAAKDAGDIADYMLSLDPVLAAEVDAIFAANLLKAPMAEAVHDAELVSDKPLPFDTSAIVTPKAGINEHDPRWPSFVEQLKNAAKPFAIEPASVEKSLAAIAPTFTAMLEGTQENGYEPEEVITLVAHQIVNDLRAESIRESRWDMFAERAHEIGDEKHGIEAMNAVLSIMSSHYRAIIADGTEQKLTPQAIDVNVRQFIYGSVDRKPVDANLIDALVVKFSPSPTDDFSVEADDSVELTADSLPFDVSEAVPAVSVAVASDLDDFAEEVDFSDSVQLTR